MLTHFVNNAIMTITGVLKDYLRELPEPLLTKCLYQMLVDALGVCLPDDPEGNARLLFSIIECLPKPNRVSLFFRSMLVVFYLRWRDRGNESFVHSFVGSSILLSRREGKGNRKC